LRPKSFAAAGELKAAHWIVQTLAGVAASVVLIAVGAWASSEGLRAIASVLATLGVSVEAGFSFIDGGFNFD
jgi:hypothetical protein